MIPWESIASVGLVTFALAEIISCVETWPEQLPSSEENRTKLANRLAPRMRRLTRAMGWMTVGLAGVLIPAAFALRLPVLVALVPLAWSLLNAPHGTSGIDSAWLHRVKISATAACSLTGIACAASLVLGFVDRNHRWLFAAAALLFAGAHAHALVARAADEVLQLASHHGERLASAFRQGRPSAARI